MKRTVQLLFAMAIMAVCYSTTALAAVDPYEALEVTPAEGVVTSLQHFTITFADMPVTVNASAIPTLEKGGGPTLEGTMRASEDGKVVIVDFDVVSTASGQYFLNLPEGSIIVNGQRLLPLSLRFSINGTIDSFYEQITIDPAEGEVESLDHFTISLPQYVGEIEYGSMALLTNTTTGETYEAEMYGVGFHVLVYFGEEVTEPGQYVLTIPNASIIIYTLGEDVHELNFYYSIAGGTEVLRGDVDGDGKLSIADVTALIDLLLSGTPDIPAEADVDGDTHASIADVTALIDLLLSGN